MKVLQACSGGETRAVWTGTIKRLIHRCLHRGLHRCLHRYLEQRNERRALRRRSAENEIESPYGGRRWCDATERELIGDLTNIHDSHF
jgi:hypothetical protein